MEAMRKKKSRTKHGHRANTDTDRTEKNTERGRQKKSMANFASLLLGIEKLKWLYT
jgi:hypothetical protein